MTGTNVIASWRADQSAAELVFSGHCLGFRLGGQLLAEAPHDFRERLWVFVGVTVRPADSAVSLLWGQHGRNGGPYQVTRPVGRVPAIDAGSALLLGGRRDDDGTLAGALDGKLARPMLIAGECDEIALMDLMNWGPRALPEGTSVVGNWLFGSAEDLDRIIDASGRERHGYLVNGPALGITGPGPAGHAEAAPPPAGPPYDSAHFHTDDLDDCRWPRTHSVRVPADAPSGFYLVRASDGGGRAELPFIVTPARPLRVLLVAPTYTWQAYANLGRDPGIWPGRSHYALHGDGSPVYITTRLKPMPTIEPGARVEVDGVDAFAGDAGGGPAGTATHLLMADLYANYWLERAGVPFGVITDEDLQMRGEEALAGCRTLILSAHPEYVTAAMLDVLESFIAAGGSLIYLGGNGLYWVSSVRPDKPHLLEVRRGGGSQTSAAAPGEDRHVFDRQPGGTWPAAGRPPDGLLGVGFCGFGWDEGVPYVRTPQSRDERVCWVFDGVAGEVIGTRGLNMGGAVAFEFDRRHESASPPGTIVLATAEPKGGAFFRSFEDGAGRAPDPLVRCDMTIRQTPAGGLVFSLGSVAASGCLPVDGGDNDLARICGNVLRRTLA
jgi:N,N-dimethylformamidase